MTRFVIPGGVTTLSIGVGAVMLCLLAGCASQPPAELKSARSAYADLAKSPAVSVAPTDVYEAKKALDRAEKTYGDQGDEPETRDLAYVAERKVITARARANMMLADQQKKEAIAEMERVKAQQALAMRQQLGQTKAQLEQSEQQLASERQARAAAEQRTQDALSKIKGFATTKQDPRGLVMTLSGSVLFATGKSELLPTAQKRLADVVAALKDDPRGITIVGHTDSTGSADRNQQLSQRRAEAVRTYVITHGVPEDRVRAQGMGPNEPVADNKTAEGRANNRRVEIILSEEGTTKAPRSPSNDMQPQPQP